MLIIDWQFSEEHLQKRIAANEFIKMELGVLGLLLYLLKLPNPQKFEKDDLYYVSKKDSKRKIDRFWNELVKNDYLLEYKNLKGSLNNVFVVTDYPFSIERKKELTNSILEAGTSTKTFRVDRG